MYICMYIYTCVCVCHINLSNQVKSLLLSSRQAAFCPFLDSHHDNQELKGSQRWEAHEALLRRQFLFLELFEESLLFHFCRRRKRYFERAKKKKNHVSIWGFQ